MATRVARAHHPLAPRRALVHLLVPAAAAALGLALTAACAPGGRAATVAVPEFSGAAPNSALNDAFTPGRAYARAVLPLAAVKDAKDGVRYTAVFAGEHKNDLSPHEPLSDPARAQLQAQGIAQQQRGGVVAGVRGIGPFEGGRLDGMQF